MVYIYINIWGILMVNVTIYGIHTDPMGSVQNQRTSTELNVPMNRRALSGTDPSLRAADEL